MFVLVFVAACDYSDCFPDYEVWVACKVNPNTKKNEPVLLQADNFTSGEHGHTQRYVRPTSSPTFNPNDYDCSHAGSPPQPKSSTAGFRVGTPSNPLNQPAKS